MVSDFRFKFRESFFLKIVSKHSGQVEVINELLRMQADTKVPYNAEKTLLDVATEQGNNETIVLLTTYEQRSKKFLH